MVSEVTQLYSVNSSLDASSNLRVLPSHPSVKVVYAVFGYITDNSQHVCIVADRLQSIESYRVDA